MTHTEYAKVGFAILRSLEDGHQIVGPMLRDAYGVRCYLDFMRSVPKPVWRVEMIVWVREKMRPEGWNLYAEPVETPPASTASIRVLRRGR